MRARLGGEAEPASQVRVEDVEAAGAELEHPRLLVHEHVVPNLDVAGQPRVRHARDPVDLEPDEALVPLRDRGDAAAPKRTSGIDERERDVDHRVEVGDRDVLVGGVDLRHPVREVEARQPALR